MTATALRVDDQWYQPESAVGEFTRSSFKPVVVARPQLSSPSVAHRSKWAKATVDRMVALAPLRENWDQRGSAAIRGDVLSFAWQMLSQIMPEDGKPPVIVPLGNGGVQLEWSSLGAELEVEISRPFQVSALLTENANGQEVEEDLPTETWDCLTDVIREHFRG